MAQQSRLLIIFRPEETGMPKASKFSFCYVKAPSNSRQFQKGTTKARKKPKHKDNWMYPRRNFALLTGVSIVLGTFACRATQHIKLFRQIKLLFNHIDKLFPLIGPA